MNTSGNGVKLVAHFEGFRANAYLDANDGWTIGFGTMRDWDGKPVTKDHKKLSVDDAYDYLRRDLLDAEVGVKRYVKVPLNQNEFDAMVSFTYNLGSGNLQSSTLLRKLNAGDKQGAAEQFGRWIYDDGQVEKGLVRRRKCEAHLFSTGKLDYFE